MLRNRFACLLTALGVTAVVGCGSSSTPGGSGGEGASGAGTGGGSNAGTGGTGANGTGGTTGSGGAVGTGGAMGTGGASGAGTGGAGAGTGGATGTGGAGAGTGGAMGTGGARDAGGTGGAVGTGGTRDAGGPPADAGNPGGGVSVTQYHNNASRDGVYLDPRMTRAAAAALRVDTTFTRPTITGPTFAQPLYLAGTAGRPDLVIVATEQDHVLAYNAATGGAPVWDRTLGTPVPRAMLPCGNFNPVGVTGTPVLDVASRTVYVDGMILGTGNVPKHQVFALNGDTGAVLNGWPVDLDATVTFGALAFQSSIQNQRGALALMGGRVFVPFGGHVGDCQMYHGWVAGITTATPTQVSGWATRGFGGGIWGPGGIASDGTSVFVTTGNTMGQVNNPLSSPATYSDGESIFRLPASLTFSGQNADFYAPANWAQLDNGDADLGGTGPILVTVPGATPSSLVVALGKDRNAYVLDRANLGAMSPALAVTPVANGTIITAPVTYTTAMGTYVAFKGGGASCPAGQNGGVTAFRITGNPIRVTTAWCGGPGTNQAPAVSVSNAQGGDAIVWIAGTNGSLVGLNGDTGAAVVTGAAGTITGLQSFANAPIVVNGRIFVAAGQLTAFTL